MPKFTLTIEADSLDELFAILPVPTSTSLPATGEKFPEDTADTTPAKRGRPRIKPALVSPPAPSGGNGVDAQSPTHAAFQAAVAATDPGTDKLPSLEALKHVVTTAVRMAQKGEGDPKILTHLPGFKAKTGLDFVMNATDDHRAALFELATQAGLSV